VQQDSLSRRPVLAYDAPGCDPTDCSDLGTGSIPFLVSVTSEIPHSGHRPMYSNAPERWSRISDFVNRTDHGSGR
jgi:hypothetical protein